MDGRLENGTYLGTASFCGVGKFHPPARIGGKGCLPSDGVIPPKYVLPAADFTSCAYPSSDSFVSRAEVFGGDHSDKAPHENSVPSSIRFRR